MRMTIKKWKIDKWKQSVFFLLALLFIVNSIKAQERDSLLLLKVFQHGLNDTKELVISPIKWDKKDWAIAGGVGAATGALILFGDQAVYNFANTQHSPGKDVFFKNVEPFGHTYPAIIAGALLLKGIVYKDNYSVETSLIAAESYLLTGMLAQVVKSTAGRNRPNDEGTTHPDEWTGPFFHGNSFFSGHTSTAFSVASVFAYRYKETTWVPILSYSLATLCGMQRIYDNRHWASDVFMGAAVGTATGILLCKQWEKKSIKFYPTFVPKGAGISMVIPIK
ncbi:MAG: phosphatase PAP2 family protein [Prolixibacteraceae bacterium]